MSFGVAAGYIAMILFVYQFSFYLQLRYIRKGKNRILKKKIVKIVRKEMKVHILIGWLGLGITFLHICFIPKPVVRYWGSEQIVTGLGSFLALAFVLWSGWLRSKKANGIRRKLHIITTMSFIIILIVHIL